MYLPKSFLLGLLCPKGNNSLSICEADNDRRSRSNMGRHPLFNPEMIVMKIQSYLPRYDSKKCNHIIITGKNKGNICGRDNKKNSFFCNMHSRFHPFENKIIEFFVKKGYDRKIEKDRKKRTENKIKNQSESVHLPCTSFVYKVRFFIVGTGHDGDCSSYHEQDIYDIRLYKNINIRKNYEIKNIEDFNFSRGGCKVDKIFVEDDDVDTIQFILKYNGYCNNDCRCNFYAERLLNVTCDIHGDFCPKRN